MNYEERARYYQDELKGAPIESHMNFRCQKRLATWIRTQAAIENRDVSMIIRRLVNWAASQEGYDKNGG